MKNFSILFLLFVVITNTYGQWVLQNSGVTNTLSEVYFANQDTGYVAGVNVLLKTEDGGLTWETAYSGDFLLEGIYFSDLNNGFAVGYDFNESKSLIVKTTDAGATWSEQLLETSSFLSDVFFVNASTGFIVGSEGEAFRTTNGGASWDSLNINKVDYFQSVYFTDDQNGIIVGGGPLTSLILKTDDGGTSWSEVSSPSTEFLQSVFFPSASVGYAVGWNGEIIKTTDGGNNWITQSSVANYGNLDVFFVSDRTGYIVGGESEVAGIQKTEDGGLNWNSQTTTVNNGLVGVFFPTEYTGFSVGAEGTILRIDDVVTGFMEEVDPIDLSTYPNPFVSEVKISFNDPLRDQVHLTIFDAHGNEVFQSSSVSNNHTIDLNELNTGTYVLSVEYNGHKLIRKLIKG